MMSPDQNQASPYTMNHLTDREMMRPFLEVFKAVGVWCTSNNDHEALQRVKMTYDEAMDRLVSHAVHSYLSSLNLPSTPC